MTPNLQPAISHGDCLMDCTVVVVCVSCSVFGCAGYNSDKMGRQEWLLSLLIVDCKLMNGNGKPA